MRVNARQLDAGMLERAGVTAVPRSVAAAILWMLAVHAAWRGFTYAYGIAGTATHHVESAWLLLVAVGGIAGWLRSRTDAGVLPAATALGSARILPAAVLLGALAFVIYAPALGIGLLSDDFHLMALAREGAFVSSGWEFVRPLPLLAWHIWTLLLPPHGLTTALHAFNVVLHISTALLVYLTAIRLGCTGTRASAAAVAFLVFPLAVEPVAWLSGVFDLALGALAMAAVLVALSGRPRRVRAPALLLLTAAALACKETAVVVPVLVGLTIWLANDSQRDYGAVIPAIVLAIAYAAWRTATSDMPASHTHLPSGYELKNLIVRPFAALALPYHDRVIGTLRVLVAAELALLPFVFAALVRRGTRDQLRAAAWAALWTLVSVAPLSTMFFVSGDLQGSRYLYLASAGWAVALSLASVSPATSVVAQPGRPRRIWSTAAMVLVCVTFALLVRAGIDRWKEAAALRDRVLDAYAEAARNCRPASISGLPDTVDGAYVFRNGFEYAVGRPGSSRAGLSEAPTVPCRLQWHGDRFAIVEEPAGAP